MWLKSIFQRNPQKNTPGEKILSSGEEEIRPVELPETAPELSRGLNYCQRQSRGQVRDKNEDCIYAGIQAGQQGSIMPGTGLFVVADGMGGHLNGEMASSIAVQTFIASLLPEQQVDISGLSSQVEISKEDNHLPIMDRMKAGLMKAHTQVLEQVPGGGTTMTAALITDDGIHIAHVGDSRAYLIHKDGYIHLLTKDHSLVQRLVDLGQLTEKSAEKDRRRNILYRAIGQHEPLEPDYGFFQFPEGATLMLCSDGLWGVVSSDDFFKIIDAATSLDQACSRLIDAANQKGGPDNISVVLVTKE